MIGWLLLRRFSLRHWRMTPGQNALLVLILALGVGVFIAIRLANRAAVASFNNFAETLIGQSDWVIEPGSGDLPDSVLPEIRRALGARPVDMIPVVETTAAVPMRGASGAYDRQTYSLLGLDLIGLSSLPAARAALGRWTGTGTGDFWHEWQEPNRVWVPPALPASGMLRVLIEDQFRWLPIAGVLRGAPGSPPPPDNVLVMDLPDLQALTHRPGRIDRVEFVAEPGPRLEERRAELGELLTRLGGNGERWLVRTPGVRRETADKMTEAFRLNLTILSLIALLVGLYLIFQALDGAVVRRRGEIAVLRSLGVEEAAIRWLWLGEAATLGAIGGAAGVLLGWLGAQGAVRAIGRTVNMLYFATTVRQANLDGGEIVLGLAMGVAASVVAGWWPALEAARTPPAQILTRAAAPGAALWRNPLPGLLALAAGLVLIRVPPLPLASGAHFPLAGYAAAFFWILGGGILCASAVPWVARRFHGLGRRGPSRRVALGHLARPSGRHRLAVASLLGAVGMSAGMAILVSSFESTIRGWMARSLQADLYVYSDVARNASADDHIPVATWKRLAAQPGVALEWVLAAYPIQIGTGAPALLTGTDLRLTEEHSDLPWVEAPRSPAVFDPARNASLCLVSESYSDRFGVHRGDRIALPTPSGTHRVTVAGVYSDYGNERGTVMVQWHELVRWMHDDSATHISLFLAPHVSPIAMRWRLKREFPGLQVLTYAELRGEILTVFRQTFTITYALEIIGVTVAVTGLALAMASILLDRRDELTSLRALGFSRAEMAWAGSAEGLALALWSIVGGLALSLALGWLLIHVINKQSFGWTLGFVIPWRTLAGLSIAVAFTGWLVSFGVGWWGANLPADQEE